MKISKYILFIFICSGLSCNTQDEPYHPERQIVVGRNQTPLYAIRPFNEWKKIFSSKDNLLDTKTPLVEFLIQDPEGSIKITIHNFPSYTQEDRIPPIAQISRWKRQFDTLDSSHQRIVPQSFSGYQGILYEGRGILNGIDTTILAWAMQIGSEHYRSLSKIQDLAEMKSDVTIKAVGPSKAIAVHRESITYFARNFELLEEIPSE